MIPQQTPPESERQAPVTPPAAAAQTIQPSSPRFFFSSASTASPSAGSHRRIAIAVDLSDESAYAVKWAVQNYLRPGDAVILLHVRPTSVLYGADWGSIDLSVSAVAAEAEEADSEESQQKLEDDFDAFTTTKAQDLAQPLVEAQIPFKIHIVKDHDMKERLCLEVERLGLSAVIMGSRGFGASRRTSKGRLGSVSDYCVHHCVCPVGSSGTLTRGPGPELGQGASAMVVMRWWRRGSWRRRWSCTQCQRRSRSTTMPPMSRKILDEYLGRGVVFLNPGEMKTKKPKTKWS